MTVRTRGAADVRLAEPGLDGMEILLQWLDDIDDLAATARMVAPSIVRGLAFVLGLAALLVACLWLQVPAVALVLLAVTSAVAVMVIARHVRRRSRSSPL